MVEALDLFLKIGLDKRTAENTIANNKVTTNLVAVINEVWLILILIRLHVIASWTTYFGVCVGLVKEFWLFPSGICDWGCMSHNRAVPINSYIKSFWRDYRDELIKITCFCLPSSQLKQIANNLTVICIFCSENLSHYIVPDRITSLLSKKRTKQVFLTCFTLIDCFYKDLTTFRFLFRLMIKVTSD